MDKEQSNLDLFSPEMFKNTAYTMTKHADPAIPDEVEEGLDGSIRFPLSYQEKTLIEKRPFKF